MQYSFTQFQSQPLNSDRTVLIQYSMNTITMWDQVRKSYVVIMFIHSINIGDAYSMNIVKSVS